MPTPFNVATSTPPVAGRETGSAQQAPGPQGMARRLHVYLLLAAVLVAGWVALALSAHGSYPTTGPGDLRHAVDRVPAKVLTEAKAINSYFSGGDVRGAYVPHAPGGPIWVVYSLQPGFGIQKVVAIDAVTYTRVVKASRLLSSGAWQHLGMVTAPVDWVLGGLALAAILFLIPRWAALDPARKTLAQRQPPRSLVMRALSHPAVVAASFVVFGLGFGYVWLAPGWNRPRKVRWAYGAFMGWAAFFGVTSAVRAVREGYLPSVAAVFYLWGAALAVLAYSLFVLRPAAGSRLAWLTGLQMSGPVSGGQGAPLAVGASSLGGQQRLPPLTAADAGVPTAASEMRAGPFLSRTCDELPDFSHVGGMTATKDELAKVVGRLLAFPDEAAKLEVDFGGLLLHGPSGCGKTLIAEALAGEYGLALVAIGPGDLSDPNQAESARKTREAFAQAQAMAPSVLLFNELESIAPRHDRGGPGGERGGVTTLVGQLEAVRHRRDVLVVATTNDVSMIDPALLRPGRFDRRMSIDLPDRAGRQAILATQLANRARVSPELDLATVADRTAGMTPAGLALVVRRAAEAVLGKVAQGTHDAAITTDDLLDAVRGAPDEHPRLEGWSWDRLVLAPGTKKELQELQALIEHPERVAALGLPSLSGALLYGPPGTGKTSIARVLAAEAACSFYPLKGSDLVSKWVGETERNIAGVFSRAREHVPAIVFLDEIDALAPARGLANNAAGDRWVNQLLQEIDGLGTQPGVFVLGATNRPDILDPALLRGERLSRQIEIPLPGVAERSELLRAFSAAMPVDASVDLGRLAASTEGWSGADLAALCQQAGIEALMRESSGSPTITQADFEAAIAKRTGS